MPLSRVPDERAFIITHQLIELVFKLMICDLEIIRRTFSSFLDLNEPDDLRKSLDDKGFWSSAVTASARLRFSCEHVLPHIIEYLHSSPNGAYDNFRQEDFFGFRDNLGKASGMQSAQFRLIQRALGKAGLLAIRLFPTQNHGSTGTTNNTSARLATLVDGCVLASDRDVASPATGSPLGHIAQLDDLAHLVLAQFCRLHSDCGLHEVPYIPFRSMERAVRLMRKISAHAMRRGCHSDSFGSSMQQALDLFQFDLEQAVGCENARRATFTDARVGAVYLQEVKPLSDLTTIMRRLVAVDLGFHGQQRGSFISSHLAIVRDLLKTPAQPRDRRSTLISGTAGGGVIYLGYMRKHLIPMFPALVAFRRDAEIIA
jgi:hypothetical protein